MNLRTTPNDVHLAQFLNGMEISVVNKMLHFI